ncbi:MAG: hypothetical protein K0S76_1973 [Herbinix sp.]|jgi:tetratricopeptide (TPR) repeat protein|nr:hypothetical protein [Herbinix sp.]
MQEKAHVWEEIVVIPTYEVGTPDKNPMFLEKRVYQGSSGKVYPLPVIEKIYDEKKDKEYKALFLENKYLKVMILPELGGRIQRAYDKTNGYDFVYYNEVIKPALVGLAGPWISGGIEFNWPQHHRPTTFSPAEYTSRENEDGSVTVAVNEIDVMYGTKGMASFTLYPDKAYIEIKGQLYNRTPLPQTFLWWANPAVAVNDNTFSVFPPDVHAVYDHGKRDVSTFPIATGTYYKMDYSKGVDISRYKNIPVPTSYMAYRSSYNFVGGYDEGVQAGILHIADHHISPGKKQWTWGCGDFGKAWDRNLTDENGPYIELMTGVFTDNQPDFTWLKPFEEKTFTQYFMPYKGVGMIKSAELCGALGVQTESEDNKLKVSLKLYMTSEYRNVTLSIKKGNETLWTEAIAEASPVTCIEKLAELENCEFNDLTFWLFDEKGEELLKYIPESGDEEIPEAAKPVKEPKDVETLEELYLIGLHLEQYRHATYEPEDYYLEGLKREATDYRLNTAYGALLLRRGQFALAKEYLNRAVTKSKRFNPNPYDSEAMYLSGLCDYYLGNTKEAYASFRKAAWSKEQQENCFYYSALIKAKEKCLEEALVLVEQSLVRNAHNMKARGLKTSLLRLLNNKEKAVEYLKETLALDPFDYHSMFEKALLSEEYEAIANSMVARIGEKPNIYLELAMEYAEAGLYEEAIHILKLYGKEHPMVLYYQGYINRKINQESIGKECYTKAAKASSDYCFPNKLWDIIVLEDVVAVHPSDDKAWYYLGILWYDKKQYDNSIRCYKISAELNPDFPTVHRNMAIYYYNKTSDKDVARSEMEKAFAQGTSDVRILFELDQLYRKVGVSVKERVYFLRKYESLLTERDDLYTEYVTLLNLNGEYEEAFNCIKEHIFHPWEGGEGKISEQYMISRLQLAKKCLLNQNASKEDIEAAINLLEEAKFYPVNLGEGKLAGAKDNHLDYYIGCLYEKMGNLSLADKYWSLAAEGAFELGNAMFYNDQPADRSLFKALAQLRIGAAKEAVSVFQNLIAYGQQHMDDRIKIDFFAVSLPDFLIFDEDLTKKNKIHCNYLIGLGYLGLGEKAKAEEAFDNVRSLDCAHIGVNVHHNAL